MIRLVTRVPLTLAEEIFMQSTRQLPEKLEGYLSDEDHPEPPAVGAFLRNNNLPWRSRYVPIFVYLDSDDLDPPGAAIGAYGWPFLLRNESVLPDLELVCCDDIQNAVLHHRPPSDFTNLRTLSSIEEIEAALRSARARAERYAEARLHRPLRLVDVERSLRD